MAAFKLGEPRKHRELHYGDVVVNVEGKQLKLVEGFLRKIKKKEFLVTSISCLDGRLRVGVSDYKVLVCTSISHFSFLEKGQFHGRRSGFIPFERAIHTNYQ